MTMQITVRIPDDLVEFADARVRARQATSRAQVIATALDHERRKLAAERDAEIYATHGEDPELEAFNTWATAHPPQLDD